MLHNPSTVLGPDGKILNLFNNAFDQNGSSTSSAQDATSSQPSLACQICNLSFETEKTLKLHVELKHSPYAYVYPCPSCAMKFSSVAAVIKHLSNDHK